MDIPQKISDALLELRSAAFSTTEDSYRELLDKYDIIFSESKFNHIYSIELCHTLNNHFGIDITHDDLLSILPDVSRSLSMPTEGMIALSAINQPNPEVAQYRIQLF